MNVSMNARRLENDVAFAFGHFLLDVCNATLVKDTESIPLAPKAFAVLTHLVENRGRLVTKDELLDAIWPNNDVCDAVLKVCILEIRKVLGDQPHSPQFIQTVHRRGYRFIAETKPADRRKYGQWYERRSPMRVRQANGRKAPLVARGSELELLTNRLQRTLQGDRQVVFITGKPGIGKSALLETFLQRAAGRGLRVAWGECREHYGIEEPLGPALEAIGQLCRDRRSAFPTHILERYAPTWLSQMPWLVTRTGHEELESEIASRNRKRMLRELGEALTEFSTEAPIVFVLENLNCADSCTVDLVSHLARLQEKAKFMLIVTCRTGEISKTLTPVESLLFELRGHQGVADLSLQPLTETGINEYLAATWPEAESITGLAATLHRRTGGNPLFVASLVNSAKTDNLIEQIKTKNAFETVLNHIGTSIPKTIRFIVEKQIARLSAAERRILEAASVVGVHFSATAVATATDAVDMIEIDDRLADLARYGHLINCLGIENRQDGITAGSYCFSSELHQNVLYDLVPVARCGLLQTRLRNQPRKPSILPCK